MKTTRGTYQPKGKKGVIKTSFSMPPAVLESTKREASRHGLSVSNWVTQTLVQAASHKGTYSVK